MKLGTYTVNKTGEQLYQSYHPAALPVDLDCDPVQQVATLRICEKLERLNILLANSPIREAFITNQIRREALASSIIEGVEANWVHLLLHSDLGVKPAADAIGNMDAIIYAWEQDALPLSNRLIRELHAKMLSLRENSRVTPGEFRRSQNWIGSAGCGLQNASFVPPNPTDMEKAMEELEVYLNNDADQTDPLIRVALAHYQFETIHPFLDGNGRIGRLLINQQLIEEGVINAPYLALSPYLLQNRFEYYLMLSLVRNSNDYSGWVNFFLRALERAADSALELFGAASSQYEDSVRIIKENMSARMSETSVKILQYMTKNFAASNRMIAESVSISMNTVNRYLARLDELGIVAGTRLSHGLTCYIRKCDLDLWVLREVELFGNLHTYGNFLYISAGM